MPQFDFSTLSVVLFSLAISVFLYYVFIVLKLLPEVIANLKFRGKKLIKGEFSNIKLVFLPNINSYLTVFMLKHKK